MYTNIQYIYLHVLLLFKVKQIRTTMNRYVNIALQKA